MKTKIIANDLDDLERIIKQEIAKNGNNCDLNHIDISKVTNMNGLFMNSQFNGDVSKWDVSHVENMDFMFYASYFNGDISMWNISKVKDMAGMFKSSNFNQDLTNWNVYNVDTLQGIFDFCHELKSIPYWAKYEDKTERNKAINSYLLNKELSSELSDGNNLKKKPKL